MTRSLPIRPSLARLRDQARALQRACRAGEPEALARFTAIFADATSAALSKAQTVIAREYGFASWPKLKAQVEAVAKLTPLPPPDPDAQAVAERWFALADAGDPAALGRSFTVGKKRTEAARAIMQRDAVRYGAFVQTLIDGLASPHARVRFMLAHGLDTFGDAACRPHLIPLMQDRKPRVRWMAMHALSCHACGEKPDAMESEVRARIVAAALTDPSIKVRRQAVISLGLAGEEAAAPVLRELAQTDADFKVRRNAEWALAQMHAPA